MSTITIHVRCSTQERFTIDVDTASTVLAFKQQIAGQANVPAEQQRLIYKGRVLKDEDTLTSYGVAADQTIHLVRGMRPAAPPAATTGASTLATSAAASTAAQPPAGGMGANPFAAMMGAGGFGGLNGPDVQRMQQQLMSNPEMMQNIMNSPMMQGMLNNPELLRNMIMSNPQMQRVLEQNPHLTHVLNDPAVMRQSLEAMRNPAAMREMMRSQDLAMSNIESHPEGFNALRRMYHDIQEPMMEATADLAQQQQQQGQSGSGTSASSAPTIQGGAFPNPWAPQGGGGGAAAAGSVGGAGAAGAANPWGSMFGPGAANAGAGAAANPWANMGALGAGGMPQMDPAMMQQMLQMPGMQDMMRQMLSDPAAIEAMLASNPQLRAAVEQNPALREQMPQMVQAMGNPETFRAMVQMQQAMADLQRVGVLPPGLFPAAPGAPNPFMLPASTTSAPAGAPGTSTSAGTIPPAPPGGLDFSSLLAALPPAPQPAGAVPGATGMPAALPSWGSALPAGAGSFSGQPAPPQAQQSNPEELYASQLTSLSDMGFTDRAANVRALVATRGNVNLAVERLLGGGA